MTGFVKKFTSVFASLYLRLLTTLSIFIILLVPANAVVANDNVDYEVKASLVYTLIPYIKWMKRTPHKPINPNVCTIGRDSVYTSLNKIKNDEHSSVNIIKKSAKSSFEECHVLYISTSENDRIEDILRKVNGYDVLTVSSIEGFASNGGCVEFVAGNKGVKLLINKRPIEEHQIIIDSDLLGNADTIN